VGKSGFNKEAENRKRLSSSRLSNVKYFEIGVTYTEVTLIISVLRNASRSRPQK
jgi:hypothetical protein